jgi:hypothetical protein
MPRTHARFAIVPALVGVALLSVGSRGRAASTVNGPRGVVVTVVSAQGDDRHTWLEAATLAGGERHRVTPRRQPDEDRSDFDPAVSPDGSKVAFVRRQPSGDSLWVAGIDGSNPRVLLRESHLRLADSSYGSPSMSSAWSRDGSKLLAVVDRAGGNCWSASLVAVPLDGGHPRVLVRLRRRTQAFLTPAGWSRYGRRAAYITTYDEDCITLHWDRSLLSVVSADGKRHRRLASDGHGLVGDPWMEKGAWSPDGRWIAVADNCACICNLYLANTDRPRYRRLVAFHDPACSGFFTFGWWKHKLLYTRGVRPVFVLDPKTRKRTRVARLHGSLDAVSPAVAVFSVGDSTTSAALDAVSLPGGSVRKLPVPRAVQPYDSVRDFVVALN